MIEETLWRFLESGKRKQIVIIATIVTGLVLVWPAADVYIAAVQRVRTAHYELETALIETAKFPQFSQALKTRQEKLKKLEGQAVNNLKAQAVRSRLTQLVREAGCTMRRITLQAPTRRDWVENDHPITPPTAADRGERTPFRLVSRQLTVSITGPMGNIHKFLEELQEIDRFIHTRNVTLKRSDNRETGASLDVDLVLFNLVRDSDT